MKRLALAASLFLAACVAAPSASPSDAGSLADAGDSWSACPEGFVLGGGPDPAACSDFCVDLSDTSHAATCASAGLPFAWVARYPCPFAFRSAGGVVAWRESGTIGCVGTRESNGDAYVCCP